MATDAGRCRGAGCKASGRLSGPSGKSGTRNAAVEWVSDDAPLEACRASRRAPAALAAARLRRAAWRHTTSGTAALRAPAAAGPVRPPLPAGRGVPDGEPEAVAALERFLAAAGPAPPVRTVPAPLRSAALPARRRSNGSARRSPPRSKRRWRPASGSFPRIRRAGRSCSSPAGAGIATRWRPRPTCRRATPRGATPARGPWLSPAGDVADDELAATLAHELAHLAERRLFGFPRPRWLAEGLADAIGDSATLAGFRRLEGFVGVEAQRRRWLAMGQGRAGALERLVAGGPEPFDHGPASLDYELAALFVRFLLLDPDLAPRFRAWLGDQTVQRPTIPALFPALGVDAATLERRFAAWVTAGTASLPMRHASSLSRDGAFGNCIGAFC